MVRLDLSTVEIERSTVEPYHSGKPSRASQVPLELREFIAWDGEGINRYGKGKPQDYCLFGCSTGDKIVSESGHLHIFEILDFVIRIGEEYPTAWHVGFAFNYDANMIVRSLHENSKRLLHDQGYVFLNHPDRGKYRVEFKPSKWFSITHYKPGYDRKKNPHAKTSVRIYDLFGFFQTSFIKAYESWVGEVPSIVKEGKANRNQFDTLDLQYVEKYWSAEIQMLRSLAEELRVRVYGAGFRINQWHGPGAIASYALRQHGIKEHMRQAPDEVREAARYAYAGGRFEMFRLGRTIGPVYSLDINSAYPFGITRLPSFAYGDWTHTKTVGRTIARFGVYRIRMFARIGRTVLFERSPGPLFHRDKMGNISFPWVTDGWYWSPEVSIILRTVPADQFEITEGWEFRPRWGMAGDVEATHPFLWVEDMYRQRREWKKKGIKAERALKLCMNSLYGKMAQRVGWNEDKRTAPTWHQLEWAGWVTSLTRAMLGEVMSRIPREKLIAVETDGLYTTMHPSDLGINESDSLGGWEIQSYDEILYVQSGMAWLRKGDEWTCKRRGLDAHTFSLEDCQNYLRSLEPGKIWSPYVGEITRFIGLGTALNSRIPTNVRHCVWQTTTREISPGQDGKRVHIFRQCEACERGYTAYDGAHDMCIRSMAYKEPESYPHDIPWEGDTEDYMWREIAREMQWDG